MGADPTAVALLPVSGRGDVLPLDFDRLFLFCMLIINRFHGSIENPAVSRSRGGARSRRSSPGATGTAQSWGEREGGWGGGVVRWAALPIRSDVSSPSHVTSPGSLGGPRGPRAGVRDSQGPRLPPVPPPCDAHPFTFCLQATRAAIPTSASGSPRFWETTRRSTVGRCSAGGGGGGCGGVSPPHRIPNSVPAPPILPRRTPRRIPRALPR